MADIAELFFLIGMWLGAVLLAILAGLFMIVLSLGPFALIAYALIECARIISGI